ncbi:unnamed protein product [Didymodactylos carnosus]|uniref:MACPF domain-containing protein n=1 Tax=Didymodactylos carnosus TaxID=1234261 RepID=A0A815SKS3_9BILA|nr:unnamed protein product [Didymodactylos carnosus]CAF1491575.1 unnamed protein product [Didymodactylos carnosus]CAF3705603.1 unnamed protein product [Didymodactylos carnosus]CAF4354567.1 unnamed protein product [Didymodactylos carnosus]
MIAPHAFLAFVIATVVQCKTIDEINDQVKNYLRQHSVPTYSNNENYLKNSDAIGRGYNLVNGNSVCYTGACHQPVEGFGQTIFQLNYIQIPQKYVSCKNMNNTRLLIPQHVKVDCLPSSQVVSKIKTQTISTLNELNGSIYDAIKIDGEFKNVSLFFPYTNSSQTKFIIDNLIKYDSEILHTAIKVTLFKLSISNTSSALMNVSDQFQYVIQNLPCCSYSEQQVETYINDYIFNTFGSAYASSIVVGGSAQQNLIIAKSKLSMIEEEYFDKITEAQTEFLLSLQAREVERYDTIKHDEFLKLVKKTSATTLGGSTVMQPLEDWITTVSSSPVVIELGVNYIFDLINVKYFPNDENIELKLFLIKKAFKKYTENQMLYCYNNCSGHGQCESSGYFQFGLCKNCTTNFGGLDCSLEITTTPKPKDYVSEGTVCGYHNVIGCDGQSTCPQGYNTHPFFCAKSVTDREMSKVGTICGISYSYPSFLVTCNGHNPENSCPTGYQRADVSNADTAGYIKALCYKTDPNINDLPGTLCGWSFVCNGVQYCGGERGKYEVNSACEYLYPGNGACPSGYSIVVSGRQQEMMVKLCYKN